MMYFVCSFLIALNVVLIEYSLFLGKPVEVLIEFKLMAFGKIREEDMVS